MSLGLLWTDYVKLFLNDPLGQLKISQVSYSNKETSVPSQAPNSIEWRHVGWNSEYGGLTFSSVPLIVLIVNPAVAGLKLGPWYKSI